MLSKDYTDLISHCIYIYPDYLSLYLDLTNFDVHLAFDIRLHFLRPIIITKFREYVGYVNC